jgi:hypothetical protein
VQAVHRFGVRVERLRAEGVTGQAAIVRAADRARRADAKGLGCVDPQYGGAGSGAGGFLTPV